MKFPPSSTTTAPAPDPLRDEFAAAAISGMLAKSDLSADKSAAALLAYQYADALMAERNKNQPKPPARTTLDPIAAMSPQDTPEFTDQQQP